MSEQIVDDLPYRIAEEMGLGLTFRLCARGQLPCARLRPIRDTLATVRQDERERCAKIADTWTNSHSCDVHDDNPCCHVRTGAAIAELIRKEQL